VRLREDSRHVHVDVIHDGRGFDIAAVSRGAGLMSMEDWIDTLGASPQVASTPGSGTTLRATVPVSPAVVTAS
jgi:signal transduction histidine kinase